MEVNEITKIREKIYSMSNSYLPLDMFYNDIRDVGISNIKQYDKELAYKDLEKIADFIIDLQEENKQLKQQLAEKDEEIYMKNSEISKLNCTIECFNRMLIQSDALIIAKDQDKISFAVEQLEKVKKFYTTTIYDRENSHTEVRVLLQRIDNQIKQLKGE